ncbi:translation initiation factor 1 [Fagus crenata]
MGLADRIINIIYKRNSRYLISFSLNEISIPATVSLDILQLESLFFPIQFLHHREPQLDSGMIHFLVIGRAQVLFFGSRKRLSEIFFSFWKIQERNNQPIDIGRAKRVFQCIISGSNEIHRYRKKSCQIEILYFDHLSIVNTIYKDHYYK